MKVKSNTRLVAVALSVSLMTLFSMIKIWNEAFWKVAPEHDAPLAPCSHKSSTPSPHTWLIPIGILAAVTIGLGLGARSTFAMAMRAGEELMNPTGYIAAVLGGN
jgi:multicomponent Na+:H+ antiporter subunit D